MLVMSQHSQLTGSSVVRAPASRDLPSDASVLAKARRENFTVAPLFLPARIRQHLLALYGFARLVDDIGDETAGDVLGRLDWVEGELERAACGTATHPLLQRLTPTIHAFHLPLDPFRDLIEANRVDQRVTHYATYDELLGYCALSANPIGRLVLAVLEASTPARVALSDEVCTGLQLAEHWQDIGEDAGRGRVYLPAEDLARFGCTVDDLVAPIAREPLRALVRFEVARARTLLGAGVALSAGLRGRAGLLVAGFTAGGHAALDAIDRANGEVLAHACRPASRRVLIRLAAVAGRAQVARRRLHLELST
jgi:squalene synthase HpnC